MAPLRESPKVLSERARSGGAVPELALAVGGRIERFVGERARANGRVFEDGFAAPAAVAEKVPAQEMDLLDPLAGGVIGEEARRFCERPGGIVRLDVDLEDLEINLGAQGPPRVPLAVASEGGHGASGIVEPALLQTSERVEREVSVERIEIGCLRQLARRLVEVPHGLERHSVGVGVDTSVRAARAGGVVAGGVMAGRADGSGEAGTSGAVCGPRGFAGA